LKKKIWGRPKFFSKLKKFRHLTHDLSPDSGYGLIFTKNCSMDEQYDDVFKGKWRFFNLKQGSHGWLEMHGEFHMISASQAADVCGFGFMPGYLRYKDKTCQSLSDEEKKEFKLPTEWLLRQGHIDEFDAVFKYFVHAYPDKVIFYSPGALVSDDGLFMASPDAIVIDPSDMTEFTLEVKRGGTKIKNVADIIKSGHLKYYVQMLIQMYCFKVKYGLLLYYYEGQVSVYGVNYNQDSMDMIKACISKFSEMVALYYFQDYITTRQEFDKTFNSEELQRLSHKLTANFLNETKLITTSNKRKIIAPKKQFILK